MRKLVTFLIIFFCLYTAAAYADELAKINQKPAEQTESFLLRTPKTTPKQNKIKDESIQKQLLKRIAQEKDWKIYKDHIEVDMQHLDDLLDYLDSKYPKP